MAVFMIIATVKRMASLKNREDNIIPGEKQ